MSFTAEIKNEVSSALLDEIENRNLLLGYLYVSGEFIGKRVIVTLENMAVARKIFKTLKYSYKFDVKMIVRTEKKFKMKKVFIFQVLDEKSIIKEELKNIDLSDEAGLNSFIKGVFLASGSISNPKKGGYHMEMSFKEKEQANYILEILHQLKYDFKILKRNKNYMLYLKSGEEISDFIKLLGAVNSLFYFEDIRIYRDHKNMVNRLNNCEQANVEKSLKASDKLVKIIKYMNDFDYMTLLDEKTRQVAEYRLKYPEESFQALSDILSSKIEKKVTKSYVNHHLRKIQETYERIINTENE